MQVQLYLVIPVQWLVCSPHVSVMFLFPSQSGSQRSNETLTEARTKHNYCTGVLMQVLERQGRTRTLNC